MTDLETNKEKQLWKEFEIDVKLEAFGFPDNKIYGTINIIPESSRQLIDHFFLVINKKRRIQIESYFTSFSASGFNPKRETQSIYFEAISKNSTECMPSKLSKQCNFYFTGEIYSLNPTLTFQYLDKKIILVIEWCHIGDDNAQIYTLILNDMEIKNIHQKFIRDMIKININKFIPGSAHTFQLIAKLKNGKETYRSDLMEFIVPDMTSNNEEVECITVSNDIPPQDLPTYNASEIDKAQEDVILEEQSKTQILQMKIKPSKKHHTCCKNAPHDRFPGIDHYFQMPSSESLDDDDDDVIVNSTT